MLRKSNNRKNILILITTAIGGGAERLILDQMKYHDHARFNLHVVTLRQGYLDHEFSGTKANYYCLDSTRRLSYQTLKKLLDYIRKNRIELIHTHLYLPDIYGFLVKIAIPHIKLITTKHNTNDFRKKVYWGLLDNILSLPASQILAVSKSVREFFSKYELIPRSRIKVVYHGVDISRFRRNTKVARKRAELGLGKDDFVIGIVGRLMPQKGHKYLLEALSILSQKKIRPRLLIIGTGRLEDNLKRYSQKLGIENQVIFLGYRSDVVDLYSIMNVLCLPSIFEGLGLVIVEAMMCGTITVGAKVDGIVEIIEHGITGYLFPPKQSIALAEVVKEIYEKGPNKGMIERAKKNALRFDFRKNIRLIEDEYLKVLTNN